MKSRDRFSTPRTVLFAPLLIGVASAFAQFAFADPGLNFVYLQSPFFFTALAGIAVAFACRPALARIPWSRRTAIGLALCLLAAIGPLGDWAAAGLLALLGLAVMPLNLPASPLPMLAGVAVAGVLMGVFFRPRGGEIDGRALWERFGFVSPWRRAGRAALLALGIVGLRLLIARVDAGLEDSAESLYIPLVEPNYWLRIEGLWQAHPPFAGAVAVGLLGAVLWLRALLVVAALLPFALAIRGSRFQLILVFAILVFVVGEFAPLIPDQPFPSLGWLTARVGLGLFVSALVGMGMVAGFGVVRGEGEAAPGPPGSQA